jgi:DNA-binding LacI/PurR family transcriptional regulator
MRQALAHLAALGHRQVGFVGGPANAWSNQERTRGLRRAAAEADIRLVEIGNFAPYFTSGIAAADLVLAAGVTAVIAYNDLVALGLISRLSTRGVAVPEQISVVGCDDVPLATMSNPAMTTVALPKEQAGRAAVSLLIKLLEEAPADATVHLELDTQLMVRGSTGPAPQRSE